MSEITVHPAYDPNANIWFVEGFKAEAKSLRELRPKLAAEAGKRIKLKGYVPNGFSHQQAKQVPVEFFNLPSSPLAAARNNGAVVGGGFGYSYKGKPQFKAEPALHLLESEPPLKSILPKPRKTYTRTVPFIMTRPRDPVMTERVVLMWADGYSYGGIARCIGGGLTRSGVSGTLRWAREHGDNRAKQRREQGKR